MFIQTVLICTSVHVVIGSPLIGQIVNDFLNPQPRRPYNPPPQPSRPYNPPPQPASLGDMLSEDQTKSPIVPRATDGILGLPKIPRPPPPPPILPKLPRPRPLTPVELNRGFGRALSLITILGQVDSYIAERARAVIRKLLLLVDDDSNRVQQEY
ncbi:protein VASP homolog [Macrosteles quadrilineatus]|uniref:protein VASP homolog n=1 Tax=Macrosteles quadrilineatus TaxID=74068 RepID=UPI0023E30DD9|nr:protein VASP homolog [Macrosteles quadrilineatus]